MSVFCPVLRRFDTLFEVMCGCLFFFSVAVGGTGLDSMRRKRFFKKSLASSAKYVRVSRLQINSRFLR